jgi:hypothetical protein
MDLPMSGRPSTDARHPTELGGEVLKARLAHLSLVDLPEPCHEDGWISRRGVRKIRPPEHG